MKNVFILAAVIVIVIVFAVVFQLTGIGMLDEEAYAVTDDMVTQNLKNQDGEGVQDLIELERFDALQEIYERAGSLYIGDSKTMLNGAYPLFIKNSSALLNLGDSSKLITTDFDKYESYFGLMLSNGMSFNQGDIRTRADAAEFILLSMSNGIYSNAKNTTVTNGNDNTDITMNALIFFSPEFINYYEFVDGQLVFGRIDGLNENSWISFEGYDYNYYDFLRKLGLLHDSVPIPQETEGEEEEEIEEIEPLPIEKRSRNPKQPGVPAAADPAPNADSKPGPEQPAQYIKPTVSCDPFSAQVYSINTTLRVSDPAARIRNGVRFQVLLNGQLFTRGSGGTGSDPQNIILQPLRPDTTYTVIGQFTYRDEHNNEVTETFIEQEIKTRPVSDLDPMQLTFANGELFYNKIQLVNFGFDGTPKIGESTIQYVKKIVIEINGDKYNVDSRLLAEMQEGSLVTYNSATTFQSDTQYSYRIYCEDRYGNELPLTQKAEGQTATCKRPPSALLISQKNEITNNEIKITITNQDNAVMQNTRLAIFNDATGDPVPFSMSVDGGAMSTADISHPLPAAGGLIKIPDLPINTVLKAVVVCDYDISDLKGMQYNMELETPLKIVTADLSTLGKMYFNTLLGTITDSSVDMDITLDTLRTHEILTTLLTKVRVSAINSATQVADESVEFTGAALDDFRNDIAKAVQFTNLQSKTEYELEIYAEITYNGVVYEVTVVNDVDGFKTLKKEPMVTPPMAELNYTSLANMIVLYDIYIDDPDGALIEPNLDEHGNEVPSNVQLLVTDDLGRPVQTMTLLPNTNYPSLVFTNLEPDRTYHFAFTSDHYNNGYDNTTYRAKYLLSPEYDVRTKDGVSGLVQLQGMKYLNGDSTTRKMVASLRTEVWDKFFELQPPGGDGDFRLHVVREGELMQNIPYTLNLPPAQVTYYGEDPNYPARPKQEITVDRYYDYVVELWVKMDGHDIMLDSIEFATDDEIIGLRVLDDFPILGTNPEGNYIVLNDIEFTKGPWNGDTNPFNGSLDFQGHTATFKTDNRLFYNLGKNGVLKNMNAVIEINNEDATVYKAPITFRNYGTIRDVNVTLAKCTEYLHYEMGLITRYNYPTGIIENFVINLEAPIYTRYMFGPATAYNAGIVRNGMVYGSSYQYNATVEITDADIIVPEGINVGIPYSVAHIGGVVGYNVVGGRIDNVYSLVNIKQGIPDASASVTRQYFGTITGINNSVVTNSYTVGEVWYQPGVGSQYIRDNRYGPGVGTHGGRMQTDDVYYVSLLAGTNKEGNVYDGVNNAVSPAVSNTQLNQRVTRETLQDEYWQGTLLGNQFDVGTVSSKYFPTVKLGRGVTPQPLIPLPDIASTQIDIASIIVTEQYEDYAIAIFTFMNPSYHKIPSVTVQNLTAQVQKQWDTDQKSMVTVRLEVDSGNPKYYSSYRMDSFTYAPLNTSLVSTKMTPNAPLCPAEFYKGITTQAEWRDIKTNADTLSQNYRLKADIDFSGITTPTEIRITGNFYGKIDGGIYQVDTVNRRLELTGMHKLDNISLSAAFNAGDGSGGVIRDLYGTVKNLYVDHMSLDHGNDTQNGFIRYSGPGARIQNVHVMNSKITEYNSTGRNVDYRRGGIVGYFNRGDMQDCSVTNFTIDDTTHKKLSAGGIIGFADYCFVENSFVYNIDITATVAQMGFGSGGIAGRYSNGSMYAVYAQGSIVTSDQNVGGLVGWVSAASTVQEGWADVYIRSDVDRLGGLIGYNSASGLETTSMNAIALGEVSSSVTGSSYIHRGVGSSTLVQNVYAWEGQRINGRVPYDALGDVVPDGTTILTNADLMDARYLQRQVRMGTGFDYSKSASFFMPQLYYKDTQKLLPNQTDHKPQEPVFEITYLEAKFVTDYMVTMTIKHPQGYDIQNIKVKYLEMIPDPLQMEVNPVPGEPGMVETKYYGKVDIDPNSVERYWDAYELEGLEYTSGGGPVQTVPMYAQVDFDRPIYRMISSYTDWTIAMVTEGRGQRYENFQLNGDVDFTGINVDPSNDAEPNNGLYNLQINRLEGRNQTPGTYFKFSNINWNFAPGFNSNYTQHKESAVFSAINTKVAYVSFENITLNMPTTTGPNAGNAAIDYQGIVARLFGAGEHLAFKDITLNGGSGYVGCFGFVMGNMDDIELENIQRPLQTGSYVGGLAGCVQDGSVNNARITGTSATAPSVIKGVNYVGGLVGYAVRSDVSNSTAQYMQVIGTSYIGGIAGINTRVQDYNDQPINVNNKTYDSFIRGGTVNATSGATSGGYVGGIFGQGSIRNPNNGTQWSESKRNSIIGAAYVGGISGYANTWYNRYGIVEDCNIFGSYGVGGGYGYTPQIYFCEVSNSTVSTVYDQWYADWLTANPTLVALSPAKPTHTPLDRNHSIGGVSGIRVAHHSSVVDSKIGAKGANMVGGLVGEGYEGNTFYCHSTNNEVKGGTKVGGITGQQRYNMVYSCYTNGGSVTSEVAQAGPGASTTISGDYAGGVVGYIIGNRALNGASLSRVQGSYSINTEVKAHDYGGGIFGYAAGQYDNNLGYTNRDLVAVNNVTLGIGGTHGDFIGTIGDGSIAPVRSRVFNDNKLNIASVDYYPGTFTPSYYAMPYEKETMSTTAANRDQVLRVNNTQLAAMNAPTNTTHTLYQSILGGYISNTYYYINVDSTGNGLNATPKAMPWVRGQWHNNTQRNATIPTSTAQPFSMMLMLDDLSFEAGEEPQVLPVPQFYASGADKLNIEFDGANEKTYFSISMKGADEPFILEPVAQRVYTLTYDFKSPLIIRMGDGIGEEVAYELEPETLRHSIMTWGTDYYYITGAGVASGNSGVLLGTFINLAGGEAISVDGTVYNLATGARGRIFSEYKLLETAQPLLEATYDGYTINTFKNYSTSAYGEDSVTRNFRLLVKNGVLTAMDPAGLPIVFDGLIIDKVGEEEYLTVLGDNGSIADMKSSIKVPDEFDNSEIVEMSNNLNTDSATPYVALRYKDGSVLVFNYLTGEIQQSEILESDMSLIEYAQDFLTNKDNSLLKDAATGYVNFTELKDKLIIGGAVPDEIIEGEDAGGKGQGKGTGDPDGTEIVNEAGGSTGTGENAAGEAGAPAEPGDGAVGSGTQGGTPADGSAGADGTAGQAPGSTAERSFFEGKYLPVYDMERGEYVIYDEAEMLGIKKNDTDGEPGGDDDVMADASEEEETQALQPLPVRVDSNAVRQTTSFFEDNGAVIWVIALVGVVVLMLAYIFDRRRKE